MFGNKSVFVLLAFFISTMGWAAVPQAAAVVQRGFTDSATTGNDFTPIGGKNAITLNASVASTTAGNYTMLVAMGPSGGAYQVPALKELICTGYKFQGNTSGSLALQFGYGTAALGSNDSNTGPTGKVCFSSDSTCGTAPGTNSGGITVQFGYTGAATPLYSQKVIRFPASSFPFVRGAQTAWSSTTVWLEMNCSEQ